MHKFMPSIIEYKKFIYDFVRSPEMISIGFEAENKRLLEICNIERDILEEKGKLNIKIQELEISDNIELLYRCDNLKEISDNIERIRNLLEKAENIVDSKYWPFYKGDEFMYDF